MIKEALSWLQANLVTNGESKVVEGRQFLPEAGRWTEIKPIHSVSKAFIDCDGNRLKLGTIKALIDFVTTYQAKKTHVVISRTHATAYFGVDQEARSDMVERDRTSIVVPFSYPKYEYRLGFAAFKDFLDQHEERIADFETLDQAVRFFKLNDKEEITIAEQGAVINMSSKAARGIEGSSSRVPKQIVISMMTGTREFFVPTTFLLRITNTSDLMFALTKKEHDGSLEAFLAEATTMLRSGLPKNVAVYEGP